MLILLDIDGVMVPASSWKKPEFLHDGFPVFSFKSVQALNKIIAETNANILLTTSHKTSYLISDWIKMFNARGLNVNKIERLPENIQGLNRKLEISNWFSEFKSNENFVILDDDKSLNGLDETLKEKLILTSPLVGLTDDHANLAIEILKNKMTFV